MTVEGYFAANRAHWDEAVGVHIRSGLYNVDRFRSGVNRLHAIERAELGDVTGKRLLHLQCHFGLDTLSWARLGAEVTGVDFSPEGIRQARALAEELDIPARFIEANVYDLPEMLDETFDIVFTSYGALIWLPDLRRWAEICARYVRPGGTFYVSEFHPTGFMYDETAAEGFVLKYPYFGDGEPIPDDEQGDYADPDAVLTNVQTYSWPYSFQDVIGNLAGAGLRIEHLHEFPYSVYGQFPFLEHRDDGFWHIPAHLPQIPLLFSLRAVKE